MQDAQAMEVNGNQVRARSPRRRRLGPPWAIAVAFLLLTPHACAGDLGSRPTPAPPATPERDKPPVDAQALRPMYGPAVESLGLVLTPRGGLIDRSGGGYRKSPRGTHLALYVEPAGPYTAEEYLDGILTVTKVFVPDVFERWPGIESFDVCQEPPPEVDDREEPTPATQIELTREQASAIDWDTVSVRDLIAGAQAQPAKLRLVVSPAVAGSEAYGSLPP